MGLILAGMAGGIGAGLAGAAQEFDRRSREEDLLKERLADRERDRLLREQMARDSLAERVAAREDRNILLAQRGAAGSGGGGGAKSNGGIDDFSEGSAGEEALALRAGRTVPEVRKIRQLTREGTDSLATDVTRETGIDPNDPNNDGKDKVLSQSNPRKKVTTREVPAELKAYIKAEQANLDQAMTLLRAGGNADAQAKAYGDLAKSRTMQRIEAAATQDEARAAGERVALAESKGQWRVQGNTRINEATGESNTTAVGDSVVAKNERAPAKGGAGVADGSRVQSTKVDSEGNVVLIMRDGSVKKTDIKGDGLNRKVADLVARMRRDDYSGKFAKLPVEEQRQQALDLLGVGKGDAPAAAPPANRKPLGAFQK